MLQSIPPLSLNPCNNNLTKAEQIIKGTLPSAPETLFPTVATTNFTTIISALGPSTFYRTPNLEVSTFYTTLLTYLSAPSFPQKPYILALSTPSFPSKEDRFSLLLWFATRLLWLLVPGAYHDVRANANVFLEFAAKQDRGEEVRWTVYRVGNLSDEVKVKGEGEGEKKVTRAGYIGDAKTGLYVCREGIARWLIGQAKAVAAGTEEAQEGNLGLKWVAKVPLLSDV